MSVYLGGVSGVTVQNDGFDGTYITLTTDDGCSFTFEIGDLEMLVDAVEGLREHVLEGRRQRRMFDAASAEEHDLVLGRMSEQEFDAMVNDGFTHASAEVWRNNADHSWKALKETAAPEPCATSTHKGNEASPVGNDEDSGAAA